MTTQLTGGVASAVPSGRASVAAAVFGDSRWDRGNILPINKDQGIALDGPQCWIQTYTKGGITFDIADHYAVSSTKTGYLNTGNGTDNQSFADFQVPAALGQMGAPATKAQIAFVLSSTNDRGLFTVAQSIANYKRGLLPLAAVMREVYVVAEYPRGVSYPVFANDYGVKKIAITGRGTNLTIGDRIISNAPGAGAVVNSHTTIVAVTAVTGGQMYDGIVIQPGQYSGALTLGTSHTGVSVIAGPNAAVPGQAGGATGTATPPTINTSVAAGGFLTTEHLRMRDWLCRGAPLLAPNIYVIDPWPSLLANNDDPLINPLLTADGVHLNTVGNALSVRSAYMPVLASNGYGPRPLAMPTTSHKFDSANDLGGNLIDGSLTDPLQTGTASVINSNTGAAAVTQPTVTGNVPAGFQAAIDNNLMGATSPTLTISKVTTPTGNWLQFALSGTTSSAGISNFQLAPQFTQLLGANYTSNMWQSLLSVGDTVRGQLEFEIDAGGVGIRQFDYVLTRFVPSNGYRSSHSAYDTKDAFGSVYDLALAGATMAGILRTSPSVKGGDTTASGSQVSTGNGLETENGSIFRSALVVSIAASAAYNFTFRVRDMSICKEPVSAQIP